jgi:hypothetical protein
MRKFKTDEIKQIREIVRQEIAGAIAVKEGDKKPKGQKKADSEEK